MVLHSPLGCRINNLNALLQTIFFGDFAHWGSHYISLKLVRVNSNNRTLKNLKNQFK